MSDSVESGTETVVEETTTTEVPKFTQTDVNGIVARSTAKAGDKAKQEMLETLGFSSVDELQGVVSSFKEHQENQKTAEQRLAEITSKHEETESRLGKYQSSIQNFLDAELEKIPEDKRSLIPDFSDPTEKLDYIAKNRNHLIGETVVNVGSTTQPSAPLPPSPKTYEEFKVLGAEELLQFHKDFPEIAKAFSEKRRQGM